MKKIFTFSIIGSLLFIGLTAFDQLPKEESFVFNENSDMHELLVNNANYFVTHQVCTACHGYDIDELANVDEDGNDINPIDDWKSTMMALSAKDPLWRAKVQHEVIVHPQYTEEIQDACVDCHAPLGFYQSLYDGNDHYDFDNIDNDNFALDGVSCAACHQQKDELFGNLFNGEIKFDTLYNLYGPYENPLAEPMFSFTGFNPVYSEHINDAGICASCHTLITETIDTDGNLTGDTFFEQVTYLEWQNSVYDATNITCQGCHIPRIEDSVWLSSRHLLAEKRAPFGLHTLVGGNSFMLKLMKENKAALNIDVLDEDFDETIEATLNQLQNSTINLNLDYLGASNDSALFKVNVENLAGHKFPSGYPSRRAFIEFFAQDSKGEILFHSGEILNDFEVFGQDPSKEDHYQTIRAEDEVQIYEMVFADTDGNFSTVLTRAAFNLKDNRLPPKGFTKSHLNYDTVQIVGLADVDPDFNEDTSGEGSGTDDVYYNFHLDGYEGDMNVTARMWYQSLPPKWMVELFDTSDPVIDEFETMYDNADQQPVLMAEEILNNIVVATNEVEEISIQLYPNPATNQQLTIELEQELAASTWSLYNVQGQLIQSNELTGRKTKILISESPGIYFISIESNGARVGFKRIVKL